MVALLVGRILGRSAWLMALFLFLACLIPFAGGTSPFRGDLFQVLDPFGFSLLSPARRAFGPHSMLTVAGLFLIPAALIHWRRLETHANEIGECVLRRNGILPLAALTLYCLFILLSLPLIARSSAFPRPAAIGITILDLVLLGITMAWIVDLAISFASPPRLQALVGWMAAGGLHLARSMSDAYLIAPQVRELVEADWTTVTWHGVLAIVAVTLYALPIPRTRARATL